MYNGSDYNASNGSSNSLSYEPSISYPNGFDITNDSSNPTAVNGVAPAESLSGEGALTELREILVSPEQAKIDSLRQDVIALQAWADEEQLFSRMAPLVTRVVERQIREAPQEVVEVLYPLLGGMVKRAVREAISNLAARIDAQRAKAFNFQRIFSRFRAESNGASTSAVELRDALPFSVQELFVIHNNSGLLIHHESKEFENGHDSDVISAMLTAIGDFVQDTFGKDTEGGLEKINYGDKQILLERFQYVYVAAVVKGIQPYDYRHEIRRRISAFERNNRTELANYAGEPARLDIRIDSLRKLLISQ